MASLDLSVWLAPEGPEAELPGPALARTPAKPTIELLDENWNPVGAPRAFRLARPERVEVPSGDAGFDRIEVHGPVSLPLKQIPPEAAFVRAIAGARRAVVPLAAARAARPRAPDQRRLFNPAGDFNLLLVSEQFDRADAFFAACAQLDAFVRAQPPFAAAAVAAHLRLEALFWQSDSEGLFNTRVNGRLVFGDNKLVGKFVRKSGATGKMVVVLVNSAVRGGAGGTPDRPAWVTITSSPNERWEAVALHELGHSFGLADEYDDASQPVPEPNPLEPNVTAKRRGAEAPWAASCTPGLAHDPTVNAAGQPAVPAGTIGTFEGARYRKQGRYRPTANCLMRATNQPFCPVCQSVIRRALA